MTAGNVERVAPDQWVDAVRRARDEGFAFLEGILGVDELGRDDAIRVVCRLLRFPGTEARTVETLVPRGLDPDDGSGTIATLPTLVAVLPGAAWYEREVHDFFGVRFAGGDDAPLLNLNPVIRPLRKDFVLASRAGVPWPGAKEPGEDASAPSRRRMAPAGVPDPEVWGQRTLSDPLPDAAQVAASLSGGRVRRQR